MNKRLADARVKIRRSSLKGFVLTLLAMLVLTLLPIVLYIGPSELIERAGPVLLAYILYWAVVVLIILTIIARQKRKTFDEPLQALSEAAKKVAEGDFSVYLTPRHTTDKYDYIDVMFQDFNKMVQDLGSLETMKSDFIASVSHEIKTPLANIQSYSTALQDKKLSQQEEKDYVNTIVESSDKLSKLVSNILKLNRLENQTIELNIEPYDACQQLTECILRFDGKITQKKLKLNVSLEDKATIDADKSMVEIIWNNLLSNAIKFAEPGGKVSIKQTSTAKDITVSIKNSGAPMSPEVMNQIFDKFYQADSSRNNAGNGLGLSLVKKIIELLDGEITVVSDTENGTTFTVTLKTFKNE